MARTRVSPVRYLQVTGGQSNEYASAIYLAAGSGVTLSPTVSGDVATITIAASGGGGGGTSDHTQLSNLSWTSSGHTGTASRIAAFDAQGAASFLQVGVDVQAYSSTLASVSSGSWAGASSITTLGTVGTGTWQASAVGVSYGGTGATTASGARTNLGVAIGSDVQAYNAQLGALAGLASNGLVVRTASATVAARTIQGGTGISVTNGDGVSGNPSVGVDATVYRQGATDVAVADGGTGASTASSARVNLGVAIGTDVQAYSPVLAALATAATSANSIAAISSTSASAVAPPSTPRSEYVLGWLNDSTLGWVARFSVLASVMIDYLGSDIPGPGAGQTLS
jgi:hypothetical protein